MVSGTFTYAQYIGKGRRVLDERRLAARDLVEAWRNAPVETCCVEFFERAEALVGGEILRGKPKNCSIGYGRDDSRLIDDELADLEDEWSSSAKERLA